MQIELDPAGGPIFVQIADQVRAACDRGDLRVGQALPSVRVLAAQLGVNRNTVARAYSLLHERGVLAGRAGRGSRVQPPADAAELRCLGSHDFGLDVLARQLRHQSPQLRLRQQPLGSTAGLLALACGSAQLAGMHLLDAASGEYNRPFLARLAPGADIRLVTLAEREQGLIVARGNPLGLRDAADLARPSVRLAARQAGSGTQLLLEHLLARQGLALADLAPPARALTTHLAVAAAVAAGAADVGLGLRTAARALDLDFVPLAVERYDLAFRRADECEPWLGSVLEALAAPDLRTAIEGLAGYDAMRIGWMVA